MKTKADNRQQLNEDIAKWVAAGGNITKCPVVEARTTWKKARSKQEPVTIDMTVLPEALKIKYGVR